MPKEPEFIDRINNPQNYPYIDKTEKGAFMNQERYATHLMSNAITKDGRPVAFPMIQYMPETGELYEFKDFKNALDYAMRTGNFKEFKSEDEALDYAKNYKKGTPLEKFKPGN
jgi:hypothetical protein